MTQEIYSGTFASLSSGGLTLLPPNPTSPNLTRTVPSPLLTLASSSKSAKDFALAGKEVEISVWDVERTFASQEIQMKDAGVKRKKDVLESGEIWRARNVSFYYH